MKQWSSEIGLLRTILLCFYSLGPMVVSNGLKEQWLSVIWVFEDIESSETVLKTHGD